MVYGGPCSWVEHLPTCFPWGLVIKVQSQVSNWYLGSGVYPRSRYFPLYKACSLKVELSPSIHISTTHPSHWLASSSSHGLSQPLAPHSLPCGFRLPLLKRTRGRLPPTAGPCLQEALFDFPSSCECGERVGCLRSSELWRGGSLAYEGLLVSRLPTH